MTNKKREPLARVIENGGEVWVCVGQKIVNEFAEGEGLIFANNVCGFINDAHKARVKEEVKRAVEEFRERAARLIDENSEGYNLKTYERIIMKRAKGDMRGTGYAVAIRALPTEPEEKP